MKESKRKVCGVCDNGYKELVCSHCGHNIFYEDCECDIWQRFIVDDNGVLQAMKCVGSRMHTEGIYKCLKCDTELNAEMIGSHGYGWTDMDGMEGTMEECFHRTANPKTMSVINLKEIVEKEGIEPETVVFTEE